MEFKLLVKGNSSQ